MKRVLLKLREAALSVLPVTALVLLLNATPLVNMTGTELAVFSVSAVFLILGIGLFNIGADLAMTPMGEHVGSGLSKSKKVIVLLSVCFVMGLLVTVAEPDLSVLANQVSSVMDDITLIVTVGVGVGVFLLIAVLKILLQKDISALLLLFYMMLFAVCALLMESGKSDFLPLSFDSGGVTTGPITVPFIMALGVGIAHTVGGRHSNENSFGLVALCSIGPIIVVMILSMFSKGDLTYSIPDYSINNILDGFWETFGLTVLEVLIALAPITVFFTILQIAVLRLPKSKLKQIAVGIVYTVFGLVFFLTAVKIGFMPIGFELGRQLAENKVALVLFGLVMGVVTVVAEPAIHVLNKQVEEVTDGGVKKREMIIALCIGVGLSFALAMIRIIYGFSVLYYLIPGYLISLGLSFFVPKLYTAIAFDSGGVASGPLTSGFILPFAIGACACIAGEGSVLSLAFGVVALVAMTPLITIQVLGFKSVVSAKARNTIIMKRILSADDEQIINFDWSKD